MDVACIRVFLWEREVLKMSAGRQFLRCLLHFLSLTDLFIMLAYLLVVLFYVLGVYARSKEFSSIDKRTLYGDPRRNITCLGSSYDLQLPIRSDGTNPNEYTMQQLCAKTIYGGAPPGQHLGGWCSKGLPYVEKDFDSIIPVSPTEDFDDNDHLTSTIPQGISFDDSAAAQAASDGWDLRFLLGCFNRCFCNYGVEDLTIQPKRDTPSNADTYLHKSAASGKYP